MKGTSDVWRFCLECGTPFVFSPSRGEEEFCPAHADTRVRREWKLVSCRADVHTCALDEYEIALPADTQQRHVTSMCLEALENGRAAWVKEVAPGETSGYEIDDVEELDAGDTESG